MRDDEVIELYLAALRGQGDEPDLSAMSVRRRRLLGERMRIVKALIDRDVAPPLVDDPVARRLGFESET